MQLFTIVQQSCLLERSTSGAPLSQTPLFRKTIISPTSLSQTTLHLELSSPRIILTTNYSRTRTSILNCPRTNYLKFQTSFSIPKTPFIGYFLLSLPQTVLCISHQQKHFDIILLFLTFFSQKERGRGDNILNLNIFIKTLLNKRAIQVIH